MPKRAFAVAAHPDDIEFQMAGTLFLLQDAGYEIHYLNIANGSCGTAVMDATDIVRVRTAEARAAVETMGAAYHPPFVPDIDIFYTKELLARVCAVMRDVGPEILLVPSPQDYMEDHQNAARLAVSAAFCRGMRNFPTDPPRDPVADDVTVYHAQPHGNRDPFGVPVAPDFFIDITSVLRRKREMLNCHQSQKRWLDESQGMDSYLITMEAFGRELGQLSGAFDYAEGWRRRLHYGFCDEQADPLGDALRDYRAP